MAAGAAACVLMVHYVCPSSVSMPVLTTYVQGGHHLSCSAVLVPWKYDIVGAAYDQPTYEVLHGEQATDRHFKEHEPQHEP